MTTTVQNTVVVLEMRPVSPGHTGEPILRICLSGVGRELELAEQELNLAIENSEKGRRDLVPLHHLRAKRIFSKATKLEAIEDALMLIHTTAGHELLLPLHGFFELSKTSAIEAIETGLAAHKRKQAAKRKRQAKARKARQALAPRKQRLKPIIEEVVHEAAPHSEELRDVLDGLDGKTLQRWAEAQLARTRKTKDRKAEKSRELRKLVIDHSKDVEFDAVSLREIQREIEYLEDESVVLTVDEEFRLWDLEEEVDNFLQIVRDWQNGLPARLRDLASLVEDEIESGCPLAGSFEELVTYILIENWDASEEFDI